MKRLMVLFIVFTAYCYKSYGQKPAYFFDNEFGKWKNRNDYVNWKVFLKADASFLKSIKQVEYYLDPSFKISKQIVRFSETNSNFTLCSNGWGEFTLRIKIVFINAKKPSLNEVYRLDLHSPAKKKVNYKCP